MVTTRDRRQHGAFPWWVPIFESNLTYCPTIRLEIPRPKIAMFHTTEHVISRLEITGLQAIGVKVNRLVILWSSTKLTIKIFKTGNAASTVVRRRMRPPAPQREVTRSKGAGGGSRPPVSRRTCPLP
ncbi:MAG: hypothetical protein M2R45_03527 [Verrucomicrobia subdivision 3 bacterium]|nr:hypothetical protein [Limisphaerales bacterium]MCS1415924.1 hypothetical protein [Limisphaerales bacterium]